MQEADYSDYLIKSGMAENILLDLYGLEGEASPLPGEYDMNFKIRIKDEDRFILKISRPGTDPETLDFQQKLLSHLEGSKQDIKAPMVIKDKSGNMLSSFIDRFDQIRLVRLLTWIPGRVYHQVNPKRDDFRLSLGLCCGKLAAALEDFDHPMAHRVFEWDLANSLWTVENRHIFKENEKSIVTYFQDRFSDRQKGYKNLPRSVIHNDANDHNLIVSNDLKKPEVLDKIRKEVSAINKMLGSHEQINRIRLVSEEWTPASGELSPTLKLRRNMVMVKYQHLIDDIYSAGKSKEVAY